MSCIIGEEKVPKRKPKKTVEFFKVVPNPRFGLRSSQFFPRRFMASVKLRELDNRQVPSRLSKISPVTPYINFEGSYLNLMIIMGIHLKAHLLKK